MSETIKVTRTNQSHIHEVDFEHIQFGHIFADHMFIVDYDGKQWQDPRILPFGNISVSPALSSIHYGQSIFEGMKAFKSETGEPLLFRPLDNLRRLNKSAHRMCMPDLPEDLFLESLMAYVDIDKEWIPTKSGSSLYLRPFMFATDDFLGVRPSERYSYMVYGCPVNAYYNSPLSVKIEDYFVRAAIGGTGSTKCAGNYGASMYPTKLAKEQGYDQVLWTDAANHKYIEETGTTNCFIVTEKGVLTPGLNDSLLAGITRDSAIRVIKDMGIEVEERPITVTEVLEGIRSGFIREMFVTGTAATIVSIYNVGFKGEDYKLPDLTDAGLSNKVLNVIDGIRTGRLPDPYGWSVKVGTTEEVF